MGGIDYLSIPYSVPKPMHRATTDRQRRSTGDTHVDG